MKGLLYQRILSSYASRQPVITITASEKPCTRLCRKTCTWENLGETGIHRQQEKKDRKKRKGKKEHPFSHRKKGKKKDTHFLIEIFGCPVLSSPVLSSPVLSCPVLFGCLVLHAKPSAVIMLATSSSRNVGTDLEGSATVRNEM